MKNKLLLLVFLLLLSELMFSQQNQVTATIAKNKKSSFDVIRKSATNQLKNGEISNSKKIITNLVWEATMMDNGYFTLGTHQGISEEYVDDNCELSFGHPYAMTSFAYPVIDGQKINPFEPASNINIAMRAGNDTLFFSNNINRQIETLTKIYFNSNNTLNFSYQIINVDNIPHKVGMGLIFDAAIGKWGDGYLFMNNEPIKTVTKLNGAETDSVVIWERAIMPKGLGLTLNFNSNKADEIVIGNWFNEYSEDTTILDLYDLAVHSKWKEKVLQANESIQFEITFTLIAPDYNNQMYLRWDMPNFLSIENQLLFPSELVSNVEILNNNQANNDLKLRIKQSDFAYGWETTEPFEMNTPDELNFQQAQVSVPEIYDSLVVPITLQLIKSGILVDELTRYIFVPASPFSYTGLNINIDTAYTLNDKLNVSFNCTKVETDQMIYDLDKYNIMLFDNDVPIKAFDLGRDTSGGVNNSDIIFVLDVTGSMGGEIEEVRDNIIEFTDSLSARGINYRLGMVTFLDVIENIYDFTSDVQEFQLDVSSQYAHGGDDQAENSLDALSAAAGFDFRENANRTIIWITDADYHISDNVTQQTPEAVITQLLAQGIQVNCIGTSTFQADFYDQIILNTGGNFFDINGNFRDILLEVSRLNQATNYFLTFNHPNTDKQNDVFTLEVHQAGLGGKAIIYFDSPPKKSGQLANTTILVYPNPFIADSKIEITNSDANTCKMELYNSIGQQISNKTISGMLGNFTLNVSEIISPTMMSSNQLYLLKISVMDIHGITIDYRTEKIKKY